LFQDLAFTIQLPIAQKYSPALRVVGEHLLVISQRPGGMITNGKAIRGKFPRWLDQLRPRQLARTVLFMSHRQSGDRPRHTGRSVADER
jgi:hypothetical protein